MKQILFTAWLFAIISNVAIAQNQLSLPIINVNKNDLIKVPISLSNDSTVTALQFEFDYPDEQIEYLGAALTARKADHIISASILSKGKVRILVYSPTQQAFYGTSGDLIEISLKVGSEPKSNYINLSNVVMSNEKGNSILVGIVNGNITVNGSKGEISTFQLDYGRVANVTSHSKTVVIYNHGNEPLYIDSINFTDSHFYINNFQPSTVHAKSYSILYVNFKNDSGDKVIEGVLNIYTSDPLPGSSSFNVNLKASAYSLNSLKINSVNGKAGEDIIVPIFLENQTELTGIQFEITLPESANYINNSFSTGTIIPNSFNKSINQIGNRLKFIFFNTNDSVFPASSGELCSFKIKLNSYPGNYNNVITSTILCNKEGNNVISSISNGNIHLTAPRLSVISNISFGSLRMGDSIYEKTFTISNIGDEPLVINNIEFDNSLFAIKNLSLPLILDTYQSKNITVQIINIEPGQKHATMSIESNDLNKVTSVVLSGHIYSNFELYIPKINANAGDSTMINIGINNDQIVTAFQFDIELPKEISMDSLEITPTNRIKDWIVFYSKLSDVKFRFVGYSITKSVIYNSEGIIFSFPIKIPLDMLIGIYEVKLDNIIILNSFGKNVVTNSINGKINIDPIYNIFEEISICQGDSYRGWTTSGVYKVNLTTITGCDSIVTTNLTVNPSYNLTENITICGGESYNSWTSTGTYSENYTTTTGCDSIIITNLNVLTRPIQPILATNKEGLLCKGESIRLVAPDGYKEYLWNNGATTNYIDISNSGEFKVKVTNSEGCESDWSDVKKIEMYDALVKPTISINGNLLTSSFEFGNQWYKENLPIEGAVNQTYKITESANYYVQVKNEFGCLTDTSDEIYVNFTFNSDLSNTSIKYYLYPNPSTDYIQIKGLNLKGIITLTDISGHTILIKSIFPNEKINLFGISPGVYLLKLKTIEGESIIKVVKQ